MAYAYPAEPVPPSPARKGGDADADIVREFKVGPVGGERKSHC